MKIDQRLKNLLVWYLKKNTDLTQEELKYIPYLGIIKDLKSYLIVFFLIIPAFIVGLYANDWFILLFFSYLLLMPVLGIYSTIKGLRKYVIGIREKVGAVKEPKI